ncbi:MULTISPECIES: TadE/TadG family type IV pilus assembly protein [Bacillaceae]|uniref:Pilus assembly protein n=1 Tax=Evansella alkalicola TaxID=745819 RepID=A0ABS6K2J1_9BACI|nr:MULTISPECIES: TadE/TadG family type IV pilus assembly protein [Bacillaceae]MBU9724257.1 pilus assembly protein [Bacillus alkalicola]
MKLLRKREDGSITLEAAIVMPIFILFLIFLIFMIRFAITDIALNRAVSETAKQVSTQFYPVNKVVGTLTGQVEDVVTSNPNYIQMKDLTSTLQEEVEGQLIATFGPEGYELLIKGPAESAGAEAEAVLEGIIDDLIAEIESHLAPRILEPLVHFYLEDNQFVNKDNVEVLANTGEETYAIFPNPFREGEQYLLVTVAYDIEFPLINNTYRIKKQAYERVWLGS